MQISCNKTDVVQVATKDEILFVTINRAEKRNALNQATFMKLAEIFETNHDNQGIKIAVLTSRGDKSFAAGGDLQELSSIRTMEEAAEMSRYNRSILDIIRKFPVPVVAALNGNAVGGGAELAVACDLRVAAKHASIGFIQGRLGITTAWGGAFDLGCLVGASRSLGLLCRGDILTADEALAIGLVDWIARTQSLEDAVLEYCRPMLEKPRHVLIAFKKLAQAQKAGASRTELAELETAVFSEAWVHEDHWRAAGTILQGGRK